ncbi:hypothetical protein T492DRAFT_1131431 [Pavlovales sp. CCMP2436]|nr:hypothetical protein T492DRAFT_1131431 [Pavlovales sp. CCMP2436]
MDEGEGLRGRRERPEVVHRHDVSSCSRTFDRRSEGRFEGGETEWQDEGEEGEHLSFGPARAQLAHLEPLVAKLDALELERDLLCEQLAHVVADEAHWRARALESAREAEAAEVWADCDVARLREERDAYATALRETEHLWAEELELNRDASAAIAEHVDGLLDGRDTHSGQLAVALTAASYEYAARTEVSRAEADELRTRAQRFEAGQAAERQSAESRQQSLAAQLESVSKLLAQSQADHRELLAGSVSEQMRLTHAVREAEDRLAKLAAERRSADDVGAAARREAEEALRMETRRLEEKGAKEAKAREAAHEAAYKALLEKLERALVEAEDASTEVRAATEEAARLRAALDRQWALAAAGSSGGDGGRKGAGGVGGASSVAAALSAEEEIYTVRRENDALRRELTASVKADRAAREALLLQADLAGQRGLVAALQAKVEQLSRQRAQPERADRPRLGRSSSPIPSSFKQDKLGIEERLAAANGANGTLRGGGASLPYSLPYSLHYGSAPAGFATPVLATPAFAPASAAHLGKRAPGGAPAALPAADAAEEVAAARQLSAELHLALAAAAAAGEEAAKVSRECMQIATAEKGRAERAEAALALAESRAAGAAVAAARGGGGGGWAGGGGEGRTVGREAVQEGVRVRELEAAVRTSAFRLVLREAETAAELRALCASLMEVEIALERAQVGGGERAAGARARLWGLGAGGAEELAAGQAAAASRTYAAAALAAAAAAGAHATPQRAPRGSAEAAYSGYAAAHSRPRPLLPTQAPEPLPGGAHAYVARFFPMSAAALEHGAGSPGGFTRTPPPSRALAVETDAAASGAEERSYRVLGEEVPWGTPSTRRQAQRAREAALHQFGGLHGAGSVGAAVAAGGSFAYGQYGVGSMHRRSPDRGQRAREAADTAAMRLVPAVY